MFIGHFAVGMAAKRVAPSTSLGLLVLAPLFLDVLWPIFLLAGLESVRIVPGITVVTPLDLHDYPYSHSLLMAAVWSVLFGGVYFAVRRDGRVALLLGALVFSHWILDWITHMPDMPLAPGSATYVGLGLWNSLAGTLVVEGSLYLAGVYIYARTTRARDKIGLYAWWGFVVFLIGAYLGSLFGSPPPSQQAIGIASVFATAVILAWVWWLDRHREASN